MSFMGIGGDTESNPTTIDASGAEAQAGNQSSTQARDNSLAIGRRGKLLSPGALDFSGSKGAITFNTTSDPELIQAILGQVGNLNNDYNATLKEILDQANANAAAAAGASSANLDKTLAAIAPLAQSKQTEGASLVARLLWGLIAGAAIVAGIYFWRRRG